MQSTEIKVRKIGRAQTFPTRKKKTKKERIVLSFKFCQKPLDFCYDINYIIVITKVRR